MIDQTRFITKDQQAEIDAYWGRMFSLGTLGGRASVFRVVFHDGVSHNLHCHPRHAELVIVTKGVIQQTIGEQSMRLEAGESAVIPREMPHKAIPLVAGTEVVVAEEHDQYENIELEGPATARAAGSSKA